MNNFKVNPSSGRGWEGERGGKKESIFQIHHTTQGRKIYIAKGKISARGESRSVVRLFATPWTVAYQGPLSMGFPRHEYWSGLPFLLQGIFLTQGVNPSLPHCRQTLYRLSYQGSRWSDGRLFVLSREGYPPMWAAERHRQT